MSRITVSQEILQKLEHNCRQYHSLKAWGVNDPSSDYFHQIDFTIGYLVPYRSWQIYKKFGLGLGIASMQGREHKHEVVKRFIMNSNPSKKWEQVFLYDEVVCHYLPTELKFTVDGYYCMSRAKKTNPKRFTPQIEKENLSLACGSADCKLCTDSTGRLHFLLIADICTRYTGPGGKGVPNQSKKGKKKQ